jgi:CubicO group peptidase (beta-lactamase class C family)
MKTRSNSNVTHGTQTYNLDPAPAERAAVTRAPLITRPLSRPSVTAAANLPKLPRLCAFTALLTVLGASACGSEGSDTATSDLDPASDAGETVDAGTVGSAAGEGDASDGGSNGDAEKTHADGGAGGGASGEPHHDSNGNGSNGNDATNDTNASEGAGSTDTSEGAPASSDATSQRSDNELTGTTDPSQGTTGSDDTTAIPIMESDVIMAAEALMWGSHFPGMALATFDASGVTWATGLGFADSALTRPVTSDTSFWLASVTKPFTGLALLRAIEETDLNLETDVASLLEANAAFTLATTEPVTVRDLVTHHSSIRDSSAYLCSYYVGTAEEHQSLANLLELGAGCDEYQPVALDEYLRSYLSADGGYYQASHFADDAGGFAYSNVGAALAGYAVELATEKSLAAYAREEIFEPLGLEHTSYDIADLDIAEVATPTRWDAEQQVNVDYPLYNLSTSPEGGLRSSVADLSKLSAALLAGGTLGETQVLTSESVTTAFSSLESADVGDVGVFWLVGNDTSYAADGSTRRLAGENGGDPGAATMVVLDLDNDFGIVILANGELADQAAADRTNELARLLYRFAEQRANAAD